MGVIEGRAFRLWTGGRRMTMTKFKLVGAALVLSVIQTPVSAQISEPSAALAQNPNFSVYSGGGAGFGGSGAMAQTLPEDAWGPRLVRRHRAHHVMKR
jgi:hypothetical protein